MSQVIPVILCGGSGTRLWPLSRSGFPKQFLVLSGDDSQSSLFQQAIERINAIGGSDINLGPTLIVTNEEHRFLALDQLRELKDISLLWRLLEYFVFLLNIVDSQIIQNYLTSCLIPQPLYWLLALFIYAKVQIIAI